MVQQFRLVLKSGPDNLRKYTEDENMTFKRGEMVTLTGTAPADDIEVVGADAEDAILGVAAADGHNRDTKVRQEAEVYVVSPEQLWEIHVDTDETPDTSYTLGANYDVSQTVVTNFIITRENETATTTISMRGPVLRTTAATTDGQGLVLVGYADEATKNKKGQKVIVRFGPGACQTYKGR